MKNLFLTLSFIFAAYTASMAQCQAWWMGWSTPNYTATFVDSSGTDPNVTTYLWDFGDNSTSTSQNPTHQYNAPGWYLVCFSVETQINGAVCRDTQCDSLYVGQQAGSCLASFSTSTTPNGGNYILFTNQSQTSGGIAYYSWSFGDGYTSNAVSPSHLYDTAGTYLVCLTVSVGNNGAIVCTDSVCTTVTIAGNPASCSALFGHQTSGLNAYFSAGGANTYSYQWDFGDSTTSTSANPTHTYNSGGTYYVCLTVTDAANNCTDTYCDFVTVTGSNTTTCYASFTSAFTNNTGTTVQFTNYSNSNTGNPGAYNYFWSFGDSTFDYSTNPTHTYAQTGSFLVCLTVTDTASNCTDTYCATIQVNGPATGSTLYGMVWSDSSTGVWNEAEVFLIEYDSVTQTLTAIDTTITQYGSFYFSNVQRGNYLLKAALLPNYPAYNDFVPTYSISDLFWYDAATVVVGNNPAQGSQNIYMIAGTNPGGPGFVGGNVNQGANKQASGDPMEHVQIMLLNMDDSPVQYTYSDASGAFSFDNVAYGTYKVYAEVLGKPTYPAIVTISAQKESVEDVALVVEEEGVYSNVTEVEVTYIDQANFYPNPVSSIGTLTFNAKEAGNVTLQVLNMLGQVVAEQELNVMPGNQTISVDMANQQAGIYLLSVSFNQNTAAHLRFIRD